MTGHSTRKVVTPTDTVDGQRCQDMWYLVYKDETGTAHTVKGSTEAIRRSLKERPAGRRDQRPGQPSKSGAVRAVEGYPEFRDLVVTPAAPSASGTMPATNNRPPAVAASGPMPHIRLDPTPTVPGWLIALAMFVVAAATALCTLYFFFYAKK